MSRFASLGLPTLTPWAARCWVYAPVVVNAVLIRLELHMGRTSLHLKQVKKNLHLKKASNYQCTDSSLTVQLLSSSPHGPASSSSPHCPTPPNSRALQLPPAAVPQRHRPRKPSSRSHAAVETGEGRRRSAGWAWGRWPGGEGATGGRKGRRRRG